MLLLQINSQCTYQVLLSMYIYIICFCFLQDFGGSFENDSEIRQSTTEENSQFNTGQKYLLYIKHKLLAVLLVYDLIILAFDSENFGLFIT